MIADQVSFRQGLNEAVKTNQVGWSMLNREEGESSSPLTTKTLFSFTGSDIFGLRDLTSNHSVGEIAKRIHLVLIKIFQDSDDQSEGTKVVLKIDDAVMGVNVTGRNSENDGRNAFVV